MGLRGNGRHPGRLRGEHRRGGVSIVRGGSAPLPWPSARWPTCAASIARKRCSGSTFATRQRGRAGPVFRPDRLGAGDGPARAMTKGRTLPQDVSLAPARRISWRKVFPGGASAIRLRPAAPAMSRGASGPGFWRRHDGHGQLLELTGRRRAATGSSAGRNTSDTPVWSAMAAAPVGCGPSSKICQTTWLPQRRHGIRCG